MVPHFYRGSTYCHTLPKVWQCCWDEDRNQKPTRVLNIPLVISASRTSWSPLPLLGHKSTSALYETTPRNFTFAWQNRYNFSRKCTLLCTACFKVIFFTGSVSFEKVFKDTLSPRAPRSRERPTWWLRRDVRNPGGGWLEDLYKLQLRGTHTLHKYLVYKCVNIHVLTRWIHIESLMFEWGEDDCADE